MFRIPLLAVVSRETNRLPAAMINEMLGCTGKGLPFDTRHLATTLRDPPSTRYFLYYISAFEMPRGLMAFKDHFVLVEVSGCTEKILDQGEVTSEIRQVHTGHSYYEISVVGEKVGSFKFYLPALPELCS